MDAEPRNIPKVNMTDSGQSVLRRAVLRKMRVFAALLGVVVTLSLPFVYLSLRSLLSYDVSPISTIAAPARALAAVPRFKELPDPLAILVLDLSASMKTSDPRHDQLHAASAFVDSYFHMARGVTTDLAPAKLAVVLFSGIARVVSFEGVWWKELRSAKDVEQVKVQLEWVIGSPGAPDPREGWHTDHFAAARRVGAIVDRYRQAGLRGSIGVLFMTDGEYDPNPLVDASLASERTAENRQIFWARLLKAAASRRSTTTAEELRNQFDLLLAKETDPVVLRPSLPLEELFPIAAMRRAILQRVLGGRHEMYKHLFDELAVGLSGTGTWFAPACRLAEGDLLRMVRLRADRGAQVGVRSEPAATDIIDVTDAQALGPAFARVLAEWLHLEHCETTGAGKFEIQPGARSLAVVVSTRASGTESSLRCGGQEYPISQGLALVDDPPPGRCTIDGAPGTFEAYADSRYRWALGAPTEFSILNGETEVTLGLYRVDSHGGPAQARVDEIYADHAESVSCAARYPSGETVRSELKWVPSKDVYFGRLPRPLRPQPGEVALQATLGGLRFQNGQEAPARAITGGTRLREAVDVALLYRNAQGVDRAIAGVESLVLLRGARLE